MLKDGKVVATVATADMAAARSFYTDRLGLPELMASDEGVGYVLPDGSALQVYPRPYHRRAENTAIMFIVADFDAEVEELRQRGITFEEYDQPRLKTVDGIAKDFGGSSTAWFKDPAGTIIGISTMPAS
jgi:catechol 2,3-dioxygenase-like lactoylglutathione lyase family enzyme